MNIEQKVNAIMRYIVAESDEEKEKIVEEMKSIVEPITKGKRTENIDDVISEILVELGTPAHLMGYRYTIYAIKLAIENPDIIRAITCELYPAVADRYGTTATRCERAIRHAIECTWDRTDVDVVVKYFGNTISIIKGKPTNSEFISRMANIVKRRIADG